MKHDPIEIHKLRVKIADLIIEYEKSWMHINAFQSRIKRGDSSTTNPGFEIQFDNCKLRYGRLKGELALAEQELKQLQKETQHGN